MVLACLIGVKEFLKDVKYHFFFQIFKLSQKGSLNNYIKLIVMTFTKKKKKKNDSAKCWKCLILGCWFPVSVILDIQ